MQIRGVERCGFCASTPLADPADVLEADTIGFGAWTTIEEATTNGVLTAEYSAEWATYLEDNDCAYDEGC